MSSFSLWAAIRTIKSRVGTWTGYEQFRQLVPGVSRQEWAQAIGQARAAIANRVGEMTRPLNRRPLPHEVTAYTSVRARGFMQQIDVYVRDIDTGMVESRPYTIRTKTLRSRGSVVSEGLELYRAAAESDPDNYPEEILGAAYVGTYELIPGV